MGVTTLCSLDELVNDVFRCRLIRITHAEINNILAARARGRLQLIDNIENIRGEPFDARKFFYHTGSRLFLCR